MSSGYSRNFNNGSGVAVQRSYNKRDHSHEARTGSKEMILDFKPSSNQVESGGNLMKT